MQPLLGLHGLGRGLPGGQPFSRVKSQLAHTPLRLEQRDASYSRSPTAGRRRDAWKRRPRKGCLVCALHSADTQLSQQPVDAIRDQSPDPSLLRQPASSSTSAGASDPASSVQCRTGLPTQGDMIVAGTGDEFAGLQVAERPDTSRNSDVDYLSVRPGLPLPPNVLHVAMPGLCDLIARLSQRTTYCCNPREHLCAQRRPGGQHGRPAAQRAVLELMCAVSRMHSAAMAAAMAAADPSPAFLPPQELLAMQQNGPKNIGFFGTRNMGFSHQKLIEVLSYAMVLTVRLFHRQVNDRNTVRWLLRLSEQLVHCHALVMRAACSDICRRIAALRFAIDFRLFTRP